jgi:hypothetical protein
VGKAANTRSYTAPRVRRVLSVLAPAVSAGAIALASCGGGDDTGSALDEALGYLPKDAPFAVALETDLSGEQYKALDQILEKFPFSDQLKRGIEQSLEENRTDFQKDVRPWLGNPAVIGGVGTRAVAGGIDDDRVVAAIQVKDEDKLNAWIEKEKGQEVGERSGATIYKDDADEYVAVEEDVLISASSRRLLEEALDQRDQDDRLTEEEFDKGLEGLPDEALARVYTDVQALIKSDPDTRDAQRVEWVNALRTFGMTAVAKEDAIDVDFKLVTEGDLSDADLPIASGDDAPGVLRRRGEIGVGVRNPAQIVRFGEAAAQAVDPSGYGDYAAAKRQIEQRLGVSVDDDLIGQLTGDVAMSFAVNGDYGLRSELEDPAAFERTLRKVADVLPDIAESAGAGEVALAKPRRGGDFYALSESGGDTVVFGVVNDVFVVANDPRRAGRLASESPSEVAGAKGSIALSADAEQLARSILGQVAPQLGLGGLFGTGLFIAPLDELKGSLSASPDGMRGSFELALD